MAMSLMEHQKKQKLIGNEFLLLLMFHEVLTEVRGACTRNVHGDGLLTQKLLKRRKNTKLEFFLFFFQRRSKKGPVADGPIPGEDTFVTLNEFRLIQNLLFDREMEKHIKTL